MKKQIAFIDRDGVINSDVGHYYVYKVEDFVLNPDVTEAVRLLNEAGFYVIIVTNQGGIARGQYAKTDVEKLNAHMLELFRKAGAEISDVYYCPHHDKVSKCLCRKPGPLQFEKALARFRVHPDKAFMIGDNVRDVEAAEAAGIKGFKVEKNVSILSLVKDIIHEF